MPKIKHIFVQDCGIYPTEVLVVIGMYREEIIKHLKKRKGLKKGLFIAIEQNPDLFTDRYVEGAAFLLRHTITGKQYHCLWLPQPSRKKDFTLTLIHETVHIAQQVLGIDRNVDLVEERESTAYFIEYFYDKVTEEISKQYGRKRQRKIHKAN